MVKVEKKIHSKILYLFKLLENYMIISMNIDMLFLFSILTFFYENVCSFISLLVIIYMIILTVISCIIRNDDSLNDYGLTMKSDPDLDTLHSFYSILNKKKKYRLIEELVRAQTMKFKKDFVKFIDNSNYDLNGINTLDSDEILSILTNFISSTKNREVKGFNMY